VSLKSRLARLEAKLGARADDPFGLGDLTDDELSARILFTCRELLADPTVDEPARLQAAATTAEIEEKIRSFARAWREPVGLVSLAWRRQVYRKATGRDDYELPLTRDCEIDLERPDTMERRRALRSIPEIALLITEASGVFHGRSAEAERLAPSFLTAMEAEGL
jgi:hypothetical protein